MKKRFAAEGEGKEGGRPRIWPEKEEVEMVSAEEKGLAAARVRCSGRLGGEEGERGRVSGSGRRKKKRKNGGGVRVGKKTEV